MSYRWGKPIKNKRKINPRYFLTEQQEIERKLIDTLESISEEDLVKAIFEEELNEVDDKEGESTGLVSTRGTQNAMVPGEEEVLSLAPETKKYIINFIRKRIFGVVSFNLRVIYAKSTAIALPVVLKLAGIGPKKIWQLTTADNLDQWIEKILKERAPAINKALYPGETSLKNVLIGLYRDVFKAAGLDKPATELVDRAYKKLPPATQEKIQKQIDSGLGKAEAAIEKKAEKVVRRK